MNGCFVLFFGRWPVLFCFVLFVKERCRFFLCCPFHRSLLHCSCRSGNKAAGSSALGLHRLEHTCHPCFVCLFVCFCLESVGGHTEHIFCCAIALCSLLSLLSLGYRTTVKRHFKRESAPRAPRPFYTTQGL